MVAAGSLSLAANELRTLLHQEIDELEPEQIKIGHPKDTFEGMPKDRNHLNLFFYNVQYDGYPADGISDNPFFVRLHCLITAVGAKANSGPSSGENDLRLVGEVMRVLHRWPTISVSDGSRGEIARLQIVPHALNLDSLNHVWSMQGDTAYRLSVAYEIALAPIPLQEAVERSPRVGEIGTDVSDDADPVPLPRGGYGIPTAAPIVPAVRVDTTRPDWTPHVCFVYAGACAYTLAFERKNQLLTDFLPRVWLAADPAARIDLVWETWRSDSGWRVVSRRQDILSVALVVQFGSTNAYAGTHTGGFYKSTDGGTSWLQKNSGLGDRNVQCLAVDPVSPANVYVGTQGGVYKSADAGETWVPKNSGLADSNVECLIVDSVSSADVYAGTQGGVYKSTDAGETWAPKNSGLDELSVECLTIDPVSPANVYAGTQSGVYKSTDAGETWAAKNSGLSDLGVQCLIVDPVAPANVYAGTRTGIYASADAGETWAPKNSGLGDRNVQCLAIDPVAPATLYAGTRGGGVYKSEDAGESWAPKSAGLDDLNVRYLAVDPATSVNVHVGTCGAGVYRSTDGADTWARVGRVPIGLNDDALSITPDTAAIAEMFEESMPDKSLPGQSILYAVRVPEAVEGVRAIEVRSNPLLVTVHEASP